MTRILLCDDEAIQRAALRLSIERLIGLPLPISEIREVAHGRQALDSVSSWHPEIVFLDLRMPVMDGLEAAREIRHSHPKTKIIILTAYDQFDFAQEAIQLGVKDYLLKPANQADLRRVLEKTMAEIAAEQAGERQLARLKERLVIARPLIRQEYISDLLTGTDLRLAALEEKRLWLGLPDHPVTVLVLQLSGFPERTRSQTEEERQLLKEQVCLIVERVTKNPDVLVHRMGGNRLALLLPKTCVPGNDAGQQVAIELAESIWQAINRELHLPTVIGIGRQVNSPLDLHCSLADALQVVSCQALGENRVLHIDDLEQPRDRQSLPIEEERIFQAMRLGDRQAVLDLLEPLLLLLDRQESGDLQALEWRALELLVLLTRAAILGGARTELAIKANMRQLDLVTRAVSRSELRQSVTLATDELLHLVQSERRMRHRKLIERALSHIEQHYQERLSLEDVARLVHLSPFYLSHVFKEQTGRTFVQYVTDLRLSEAKRLLRESTLTVGQIAELVGFSDVNYFSRVFKKSVTLTPTEYRSRLVN